MQYGGEDIRNLSISVKEEIENGNIEQAEKLLNQVIICMSAYIDAQVILSNSSDNISFVDPKDIIESYINSLEESNEPADTERNGIIGRMEEILNEI